MPFIPEAPAYLRSVRFTPYRKDMGPIFTLHLWDAERRIHGKNAVGYRLTMKETGAPRTVLFEGEDFGCSPCHAVDSDATVEGIMGFLTLRPGDTDREYFDDYTAEQMDYCRTHGESLSCEVMCWFEEMTSISADNDE